MFGTLTTDTNNRILPACLPFVDFDKQDGGTSFVDKTRSDIKGYYTLMEDKILLFLLPAAQMFAAAMLIDAHKFVLKLFNWMTEAIVIMNKA